MKLLIFAFLLSCASSTPQNKQTAPKKELDLVALKRDCSQFGKALACAKLGYHFQGKGDFSNAALYYDKGCRYGDEGSCYNKKSINPRALYFKKVDSLLKFYKANITNCYSRTTKQDKNKTSSIQFEEKDYKVTSIIHISKEGRADSVVIESDLSRKFKSCAIKEIKAISFPKPKKIDPTYTFVLTIRAQE